MSTEITDNELALTGLDGSNPLAFMAALGVLRLIKLKLPERRFTLCWDANTCSARMQSNSALQLEELSDILSNAVETIFDAYLTQEKYPSPTINVSSKQFRTYIFGLLNGNSLNISTNDRLMLKLVTSFGVPAAGNEEPILRTPFSFANGQSGMNLFGGKKIEKQKRGGEKVKNYAGLRTLAKDDDLSELIGSAITSWKSERGYPSFNWCPSEYRPGAFQASKYQLYSVPGANILAFFGLSFFPMLMSNNAAVCCGFEQITGKKHFVWPLWSTPCSEDVVSSILMRSWISVPMADRKAMGVFDVRASRRLEEGKAPQTRYYFVPSFTV